MLQDPLERDQHQRFIFPSHSISTTKHTIRFWTSNFEFLHNPTFSPPSQDVTLIKVLPQVNNYRPKLHTACADPQVSSFRFSHREVFFPQNKQFLGVLYSNGWKKTWKIYGNNSFIIVLEVQRIQNKCFILHLQYLKNLAMCSEPDSQRSFL